MSKLAENAIKLNEKLSRLKAILTPAIEAARERQQGFAGSELATYHAPLFAQDQALIEAGEVLGI